MIIIYPIKIGLFYEYGVYAFLHPYSRPSSLFDSIALNLSMPYVVFILTLCVSSKKKTFYIFLFLIELFFFL